MITMKKQLLLLFTTMLSASAFSQEQLTNCGFEEWEQVSYKKTLSTLKGEEPICWSSFLDGTGTLKSTAAAVQLVKVEDPRPGSEGKLSAKINARSVVGVMAQGNLTTGCVNMGSMTATDASGNYNYINEEREDQAMRFTGRPSSFKVWLKGNCSQNANVAIHIVTKGYFQDPVYSNRNVAKVVASAVLQPTVTDTWTEYTADFKYELDDDPYYILVNISTSAIPGKGAASDVLYVDDIEMVYNESGINHIIADSDSASKTYFNIAGQQVSQSTKGMVISNGRKYINR